MRTYATGPLFRPLLWRRRSVGGVAGGVALLAALVMPFVVRLTVFSRPAGTVNAQAHKRISVFSLR